MATEKDPVKTSEDQYEEMADDQFLHKEVIQDDIIDETPNIYKTKLNVGDLFIIIFDDGKDGVNDILVNITSISIDDKKRPVTLIQGGMNKEDKGFEVGQRVTIVYSDKIRVLPGKI